MWADVRARAERDSAREAPELVGSLAGTSLTLLIAKPQVNYLALACRDTVVVKGVSTSTAAVSRSYKADEPNAELCWQTTPAMIAGFAALITALTRLVTVLKQ